MTNSQAASIGQTFTANYQLILRQTTDVNHAGSLIRPPFPANCSNWVLGHIIVGRNRALKYLAADPVWGDEEMDRYKTGSDAITSAEQALPFERLLADLETSQTLLTAALAEVDQGARDRIVDTPFGERPMGKHLAGLAWHETYHTGQLELLREMVLAAG